jgi:hypothetical protein
MLVSKIQVIQHVFLDVLRQSINIDISLTLYLDNKYIRRVQERRDPPLVLKDKTHDEWTVGHCRVASESYVIRVGSHGTGQISPWGRLQARM